MRNPVIVVKQLATLDVLSGGRIVIAMASGWNEIEFSYLGSDFHTRGKRLDEGIRLIQGLWGGKTEFQSTILAQHFKDAVFEPRPVSQKLPIWIGGVLARRR